MIRVADMMVVIDAFNVCLLNITYRNVRNLGKFNKVKQIIFSSIYLSPGENSTRDLQGKNVQGSPTL